MRSFLLVLGVVVWFAGARPLHAQAPALGALVLVVRSDDGTVGRAEVQAGSARGVTGADGEVSLSVPPGRVDVIVTREGFDPAAASVDVPAGSVARLEIAMVQRTEIAETIIVSATRAERRIEDEPLRVEVVPEEEVQEKIVMTPGDVSMLLAETNGLRVQTTSPSLGGASVRIQGLNGRYTQV